MEKPERHHMENSDDGTERHHKGNPDDVSQKRSKRKQIKKAKKSGDKTWRKRIKVLT
jgi:hypothetical protein